MRGSKDERAPGVWRLRIFIGPDPVTGNPRQVSRTFRGTKKEADTALAQFLSEMTRGSALATSSTSVGEFLDRWLEQIRPNRSPTTVRGYRFKIERIKARLGSVRLDKLSAQQLDQAYRGWLEEGLDPSSVHHLHRVMSAALRQAVKWCLIPVAPTGFASPPPRRSRPPSIPNPHVIQELISSAEEGGDPVLAAVIAVAATTGLRRGELSGLRWGDVDLEGRTLQVRRSIKNDVDGGWIVGPTKTHQERRIALDDFTISVLQAHRASVDNWATAARVELDTDAYLFTLDPSGSSFLTPDGLTASFIRLCRAVRIQGVTLHTLRHFSASMLIASGRDVRTIAGRLGHSDATTTLRVYAHMVEGRDQDAADYLGSLLANGSESSSSAPSPARSKTGQLISKQE